MSVFHGLWSVGAATGAATGFAAVSFGIGIAPHFIVVSLVGGGAGAAGCAWRLGVADPRRRTAASRCSPFRKARCWWWARWRSRRRSARAAWPIGGRFSWCASPGAGEAPAALGYTVFALAMVSVRVSGGVVVAALGPVRTARIAGLLAATGAGLAVAVATYPVALAGFVLMGAGYALVIPLAFSRAANDPVVKPGRAIASVATLGYGGVLIGPPIIGFVAEATSVRFSFGVVAVLALVISGFAPCAAPAPDGWARAGRGMGVSSGPRSCC